MEAAALSRADVPAAHRAPHHLILDEFSQFLAQSEESLTRMLSETRKYALFCVMAHQNWSQASERLKGALQNVGLEVILKAGRVDAEYSARLLAAVDPLAVKHTVTDQVAEERTHPTFFPLLEQWERHIQAIQRLRVGVAFIRLPDDIVHRIKTPTLPTVAVSPQQLTALRESYLRTYFRLIPPVDRSRAWSAAAPYAAAPTPGVAPRAEASSPRIRRHHPDEPADPTPASAAAKSGTVFARGGDRGTGSWCVSQINRGICGRLVGRVELPMLCRSRRVSGRRWRCWRGRRRRRIARCGGRRRC